MITLLWLPGDGMTFEMESGFFNCLKPAGIRVIYIPLLEEQGTVTYDDLSSDNYCKYIDGFAEKAEGELWIGGISKGCHWARVYASKRRNIKKLILIEPTTLKPDLLVEFEDDRGNGDWMRDLYIDDTEHEELPNDRKALDVIVSDKKSYIPHCKTIIIYTTRNNENEVYDNRVLTLKRKFVNYLKNHKVNVKVNTIDSDHCATMHRRNYELLKNLILS